MACFSIWLGWLILHNEVYLHCRTVPGKNRKHTGDGMFWPKQSEETKYMSGLTVKTGKPLSYKMQYSHAGAQSGSSDPLTFKLFIW